MSPEKRFGTFILVVFAIISASGIFIQFIPGQNENAATRYVYLSAVEGTFPSPQETTVSMPPSLQSVSFPIDINSAGLDELVQLPGIGQTLAQRILAYREEGNYFYRIEDIQNISGIGSALFEKIKTQIYVNSAALPPQTTTSNAEPSIFTLPPIEITTTTTPKPETTTEKPATTPPQVHIISLPMDINSATAEDLMHIEGIGETLASRIVAYREATGGYYSTEELMNVKGIGKALYNKIEYFLYADTSKLPPREVTEPDNSLSVTEISAININTASAEELMLLPAVSYQTAQNIVAFRQQIGGFSSLEELLYVSGVSKSVYNSIKDYITL